MKVLYMKVEIAGVISSLHLGEETADSKKEKTPTMVLTTDIIAMISPEGERVQLSKGLKARGNVEDWLGKVEESMFLSLRRCMKVSNLHFCFSVLTTCVRFP